MDRKTRMDSFGALSLTGFSIFLAFNQIIIKLVNQGIQPVFFAGLRSALAIICLWLWLTWRGRSPRLERRYLVPGLLVGVAFAVEFLGLFLALDLTTVTRTSIILYSMPVWLAVAAHFLLPGEQITRLKLTGLSLAFAGVTWAILDRSSAQGHASLLGDLCALIAAWCWAAITLVARGTRLREMRAEMQLFWQVVVSAPILILAAPFFGPLIRDLQPIHLVGLVFQATVVVSAGFMFWLWLLSIYPAASVASFSFLTPIFGVALGWLILGEQVGLSVGAAAALVAVGIILINRRPAPAPSPPPDRRKLGRTEDGEVEEITLRTPGGRQASILTWGAVVRDLTLPMTDGSQRSIVLGFDRFDDYPQHSPYFGALVGRFANRIADGRFSIGKDRFDLDRNENGQTTLHGGAGGFGARLWQVERLGKSAVTLTFLSPDGDQGFPGTVRVSCTYSLDDDQGFSVDLCATTDAPTHVNLTQHSYFNLDGEGTVSDHLLQILADHYTPVDGRLIPTGAIDPVADSGLDFRTPRPVSTAEGPLDHNFVLSAPAGRDGLRLAASLTSKTGDLRLEVLTTKPGLQVYDGAKLALTVPGLGGRQYAPLAGLCLETQFFPDTPNQPHFPSSLLLPGQTYAHRTVFRLSLPVTQP